MLIPTRLAGADLQPVSIDGLESGAGSVLSAGFSVCVRFHCESNE